MSQPASPFSWTGGRGSGRQRKGPDSRIRPGSGDLVDEDRQKCPDRDRPEGDVRHLQQVGVRGEVRERRAPGALDSRGSPCGGS